ncbi:MAG: hypothetical protein ACI4KI_00705 [Candidatus Fimenecus sp.]
MRNKYILYYVEGEDECKLIEVLKSQLGVIKPGKVQKINVVEQKITYARLRTIKPNTMVVMVFDTDTNRVDILKENLKMLQSCSSVSEIVTIPQVHNLEEELVRSCNIKNITELLNSKSKTEFKNDFIRVTNADKKLKERGFNIDIFWSKEPESPYHEIPNLSKKIKL